ncbi:hypothetical protein [Alicyclobacillus pomorum]|jgi:hypothetical protein|uniref:hypothetical protein n=1 Tax=Alicyclobacillus pomorum TaxID=204470 RepID=UPI00047CFD6B|nr:hypothetical protein [Alicyclobacillus pomorum]
MSLIDFDDMQRICLELCKDGEERPVKKHMVFKKLVMNPKVGVPTAKRPDTTIDPENVLERKIL